MPPRNDITTLVFYSWHSSELIGSSLCNTGYVIHVSIKLEDQDIFFESTAIENSIKVFSHI